MLVCSDWAPLSPPDHLEGPEGGQSGDRLELQPDHEGPEGGGPATALHHQNAEVSSCQGHEDVALCYSRYKAAGILKLYNKVRPVPGQCKPLAPMTMILTMMKMTIMVVTMIRVTVMMTMTIMLVTMMIMVTMIFMMMTMIMVKPRKE